MEPVNAAIVSFFMANIDKKTVDLQRQVVDKFNPKKYPHYHMQTEMSHGHSMDFFWQMNGIDHPTFKGHNIPKRFDHDVVLFLDIDALPLNEFAIDDTIRWASVGKLIGNIQRSNHIQNDQHIFVAPSVLACSVDSFVTMGRPSAVPTKRADVAEEYTFAAEKCGTVPVEFYMPLKFDKKPSECESWALKDKMPVYGCQTTFGYLSAPLSAPTEHRWIKEQPMFWHSFQIFHPGNQELFWAKCEAMLTVIEQSVIIDQPKVEDTNG